MNKEQQELLEEAYKNYQNKSYRKEYNKLSNNGLFYVDLDWKSLPKEEFINICKTDTEFSEEWGLKIEERELSLDERAKLHPDPQMFYNIYGAFVIDGSIENSNFPDKDVLHKQMDKNNIPTKLITVTYKDKTIESYE